MALPEKYGIRSRNRSPTPAAIADGLAGMARQMPSGAQRTVIEAVRHGILECKSTQDFQSFVDRLVPTPGAAGADTKSFRRGRQLDVAELKLLVDRYQALTGTGGGGIRNLYYVQDKLQCPRFRGEISWYISNAAQRGTPMSDDPRRPVKGAARMSDYDIIHSFLELQEQTRAQRGDKGSHLRTASAVTLRTLVGRTMDGDSIGPTHVDQFRHDGSLEDLALNLLAEEQKQRKASALPPENVPQLFDELLQAGKQASHVSPVVLCLLVGRVGIALTEAGTYLRALNHHQLVFLIRRAIDFGEYVRLNRSTISTIQSMEPAALQAELREIQTVLPAVASKLLPPDAAASYTLPTPEQLCVFPLINIVTMGLTLLDEGDYDETPAERSEVEAIVASLFEELRQSECEVMDELEMVRVAVLARLADRHSVGARPVLSEAHSFWESRRATAAALVDGWMKRELSERVRETIWESFAQYLPAEADALARKT